jgi:hypothetical protein
MVFYFTQFWLDGRPSNEYFWIPHKISDLLTHLAPLGVRPQWFETDLSHSSYSVMQGEKGQKNPIFYSSLQGCKKMSNDKLQDCACC